MIKELKQEYRIIRNYYRDYKRSWHHQIKLFNVMIYDTKNYTCKNDIEFHWLYRFLANRVKVPQYTDKHIAIFGAGWRKSFYWNHSPIKIFYTSENNHVPWSVWQQCEDMLLNEESLSLSLGFDYIDHPKYLRFPYWLMAHFSPEATYNDIKKWCTAINNPDFTHREKFCSFICRKDYFKDRESFLNQINPIGKVNCPGAFNHNDDDLEIKFKDNKLQYLTQFRFNLCPENSNNFGYVTEKIFDAHKAGCIPIYWGSKNNPEPDILNKNTIIFLEKDGNNEDSLKLISDLYASESLYRAFAMQPRLSHNAPEIIYGYLEQLEKKIIELVKP